MVKKNIKISPYSPYSARIQKDTAFDDLSKKLQSEKGIDKPEADEQAGKILSAASKKGKESETKEKNKKLTIKSSGSFQMKNKTFKIAEVLESVYSELEKEDETKIKERAKKKYEEQKSYINPQQAELYGGIEKILESQNITEERLLEQEYGDVIQNAFNKIINRRVQTTRATGITNFNQLTEEILLKNLNTIRGIRKHEIGMKWQQGRL